MSNDLCQVLAQAGLSAEDITQRTAEIDLLPDEPGCKAFMVWRLVGPRAIQADIRASTKRGKVDGEKLGKLLAKRCVMSMHGLTVDVLREFGILALTEEQAEAMKKIVGDGEIGTDAKAIEMLANTSRTFLARINELQETSAVLDAEDSLRKKRSENTSTTGDSAGS